MNKILVLSHPQLHHYAETLRPFLPQKGEKKAHCWRFSVDEEYQPSELFKEKMFQAAIDWAILPNLTWQNIGLVVSDMDSTLITIECIDEIAARLNLKEKIAAITERAMQGEIDFATSLCQRVSLLKGLPESELQKVYDEKIQLSSGVPTVLAACHQHHIPFMLVSGGFTFFTNHLKKELSLDYAYANQLGIQNGLLDGTVQGEIIDAQAKANLLEKYRKQLNLKDKKVLALGDGANDIPMLQAADIGVAYHAKAKTRAHATCTIDFGDWAVLLDYFND